MKEKYNILLIGSPQFFELQYLSANIGAVLGSAFSRTLNTKVHVETVLTAGLQNPMPQEQKKIDQLIQMWLEKKDLGEFTGLLTEGEKHAIKQLVINFVSPTQPWWDLVVNLHRGENGVGKEEQPLFKDPGAFHEEFAFALGKPNFVSRLYPDVVMIAEEMCKIFSAFFQKESKKPIPSGESMDSILQEMDLNLAPDLDVLNKVVKLATQDCFGGKAENPWNSWLLSCMIRGIFCNLPECHEMIKYRESDGEQ